MLNIYVTDSVVSNKVVNTMLQKLVIATTGYIEIKNVDNYSYINYFEIKPIYCSSSVDISLQVLLDNNWIEIETASGIVIDFSKYTFITPVKLVITASTTVTMAVPILELAKK